MRLAALHVAAELLPIALQQLRLWGAEGDCRAPEPGRAPRAWLCLPLVRQHGRPGRAPCTEEMPTAVTAQAAGRWPEQNTLSRPTGKRQGCREPPRRPGR